MATTGILYIATNTVNRKRYVGVTKGTLRARARQHVCAALRGEPGAFYNAIRKYGEAAFVFCVLRKFSLVALAYRAEKEAIVLLKPEYNISEGGAGHVHWLGKTRDAATRTKISVTKQGCKAPPETPLMRKTRVANMKAAGIKHRRAVVCLTDGQEFVSVTAAAQAYGLNKATVSMVCTGKRNSVFGRIFKFKGAP